MKGITIKEESKWHEISKENFTFREANEQKNKQQGKEEPMRERGTRKKR